MSPRPPWWKRGYAEPPVIKGLGKELARAAKRVSVRAGGLMNNEQMNRILKEREMLRKPKMIQLFDRGYSQAQLAQALGVSQPTISRMMPKVSTQKG